MRSSPRLAALIVLTSGLAVAPACTDRLPTFTGSDGFPEDLIPTSIEYILDAEDFLRSAAVYEAGTTADEFPGLIVANNFDGALNAHVLADFGALPDTIQFDSAPDSTFTYDSGIVAATLPDSLNASSADLSFYLWEVTESWEADSVTWESRIDRPGNPVRWQQAGGTRGALVAVANWSRSTANAVGDSLLWTVPAATMNRLASDGISGFMVTLEGNGERAGISELSLRALIRPTARPDTAVTRSISSGEQTFIYTPEDAPRPAGFLRVGGIRSERTVVRINLPAALPGCAAGQSCADVLPSRVSINRVDLILDPVPVTGGFRPLAPGLIAVRSVLEPELGARAPLGSFIHAPLTQEGTLSSAAPNYFADQFVPGGGRGSVSLLLTAAVAEAFEEKDSELAVALLIEPEASRFDVAWFSPRPRIRLVYTLPQIPQLP